MTLKNSIIDFDNSYVKLGNNFFANVDPTPVQDPSIIKINYQLASELGLELRKHKSQTLAEIFSGNNLVPGSEPLSMVYAGHQFGHFVQKLGDGRAILLGEVIDNSSIRRDIQLKGSGITPFSRQGDGRAALGPVLREYIVSEAMNALGIPSTRSLSIVLTGEPVYREKMSPGAILTRVAFGHVRTGTFQYFAAKGDEKSIFELFNYVLERHFPKLKEENNPYIKFLEMVMDKYANLVAKWMQVGFIHGVMNTDNMAITCETIDYGPCAFMDAFNKTKVFSSIDQFGRYSYANQPLIAQWNLARLAETILPLIDNFPKKAVKLASEVIESFTDRFKNYWLTGMRQKLGLFTEKSEDGMLIESLLEIMHENEADFTLTFRKLSELALSEENQGSLRGLFKNSNSLDNWIQKWQDRLFLEDVVNDKRVKLMNSVNPIIIPRNHRVEEVIQAAEMIGDYEPFENLLNALSNPFNEIRDFKKYIKPPKPEEEVQKTFCGT